ncbi:hypothetical protein G7009_14225 [Pseudomonas capeferrum]|nr:hypothetical protein [Pseudomonas capeferrum]
MSSIPPRAARAALDLKGAANAMASISRRATRAALDLEFTANQRLALSQTPDMADLHPATRISSNILPNHQVR